jgi:hypothetical protein
MNGENSMRKTFICLAILLVLPLQSLAQKVVYSTQLTVLGPFQCQANATTRDSAGNFYTTGTAEGMVFTEKKSPTGSVAYTHFFADPPLITATPEFIAVNSAGDVFVAGQLKNVDSSQAGIMLYSITSAGGTAWAIKDLTHFDVNGLVIGADGNPVLAVARQKYTDGGVSNFDLIKYNATTSAIVWQSLQSLDSINTSCLGLSEGLGHLYGVVLRQAAGGYYAISFNETTGKSLWTKVDGLYSPITSMTPRYYSVLQSGDFLVTGQGTGTTTGNWTVAMFDRFRASDGAFVFRKVAGSMYGSNTYEALSAPSNDSAGNIYWAGFFRNGVTQASELLAGKLSAVGVTSYIIALPANQYGTGNYGAAIPGPGGEEFVATAPGGFVNIAAISTSGSIVYQRPQPVSFLTYPTPIGFYIDASGNPSVLGTSFDALGDSINRLITLTGATGVTKVDSKTTPTSNIYNDFEQAATDTSGNVYVAGVAGLFCDVTKYSPSGVKLWTKQINSTLAEWAGFPTSISWSPKGEIVVAAEISPNYSSLTNLGVAKLNATTGALIWSVDHVTANTAYYPVYIQEDSAGNVVVAGEATSNTTYVQEGVVTKFADTTGAALWQQTDTAVDYFSGMAIDSLGGIALTGARTLTTAGQYEIKKYNSAGTQLYAHTVASTNTSGYNALAMDAQANVYEACFDIGQVNLYRYNTSGVGGLLKSYTIPAGFQDDCEALFDTAHGALFLMMSQATTQTNYSTTTMRVNPTSGALIWTDSFQRGNVIYNPSLGQKLMAWSLDPFGNVLLAGLSTAANTHPSEIVIRKLDFATGLPRYSSNYSGPYSSPLDSLGGIVVGSDGLPVLFGATPSSLGPGSDNGFLAKLSDIHAPICTSDTYTATSGVVLSPASPGVVANDEDAQGATVALVVGPAHASAFSLSASGAFSYKSVTGFKGVDTFTYKATNTYGVSNVAAVTITVK